MNGGEQQRWVRVHPLPVCLTHWINVLAILIMVSSGWRIYNASPIFAFKFPAAVTMGRWLGGALQWHFAAMWLLAANGLVYLVYGLLSGHFRRKLWPIPPGPVIADLAAALKGRLAHDDLSIYNAATSNETEKMLPKIRQEEESMPQADAKTPPRSTSATVAPK